MSDSHGLVKPIKKIIEKNTGADIFVHLGDGENEVAKITEEYPGLDIRCVRGNCDGGKFPNHIIIDAGSARIFCAHGHRYSVKYGLGRLRDTAFANNCSVAAFGHTHSRCDSYADGIWLFNPGSCALPRDFQEPSYGYIDVTRAGIAVNILEV